MSCSILIQSHRSGNGQRQGAGPPVRGCKLSDKQIILLCSSQPHTEELDLNNRKQDNPKNIIEYLVIALHNLKVHYQDVDPKAIIACV